MKKIQILAMLLAALMVFTACGAKKDAEPTTMPSEAVEETETAVETTAEQTEPTQETTLEDGNLVPMTIPAETTGEPAATTPADSGEKPAATESSTEPVASDPEDNAPVELPMIPVG